jgi:hypothetical protein
MTLQYTHTDLFSRALEDTIHANTSFFFTNVFTEEEARKEINARLKDYLPKSSPTYLKWGASAENIAAALAHLKIIPQYRSSSIPFSAITPADLEEIEAIRWKVHCAVTDLNDLLYKLNRKLDP